MRICLLTREYPPETGWGGIATFSYQLAHGLVEIGHDVTVVAMAAAKPSVTNDDGVEVHRVVPHAVPGEFKAVYSNMPYTRTVLESSAALWQRFLQLHEERPFDVVDAPELLSDSLYAAATNVVPLVIRLYTPHFKFMADGLHSAKANIDNQLVAMFERMAILQADAVTSPSSDLATFVSAETGLPLDKIAIIGNPIDASVFSPAFDAPANDVLPGAQGRRHASPRNVLFVGRLEERKGITHLIHAIPTVLLSCPNAHFTIIGDDTINQAGGKSSKKTELQRYLKQHGADSSVTFIDRVPLNELPNYYRSAEVCVVPSLYDNSPYTCLEAMSCGVPVIGTNSGGTKEYCVHGENGLIVEPSNPAALAGAICTLLNNEDIRQRFAQQARQRVMATFQRSKVAESTVRLYQSAIATHAKRRPNLYLKPAEHALSDAGVLLYSFDKMIYDLLYQQSLAFRLKHWLRMANARPKLFLAKFALKLARKRSSPSIVSWLERQIAAKEQSESLS